MDAQTQVFDVIRSFQQGRGAPADGFGPATELYQNGLGWDSLDAAEFSALLEKTFGNDPYSAGSFPRTVGDLVRFYETK